MRFIRLLINSFPSIISIFLLTNCNNQETIDIDEVVYDVKPGSVYDGDTIRVIGPTGEELKVRFACIDAPEIKQSRGIESRDHLRSILNKQGNRVKLDITDVDRFGRSVAVLYFVDDTAVQLMQVKDGQVFGYDRYKEDCPIWNKIESAQEKVKKKKIGVWEDNPPQYPWDWRKKN